MAPSANLGATSRRSVVSGVDLKVLAAGIEMPKDLLLDTTSLYVLSEGGRMNEVLVMTDNYFCRSCCLANGCYQASSSEIVLTAILNSPLPLLHRRARCQE